MSATINGLDLREVLGELRDFVRTRVSDVTGAAATTKPSAEQIETAVLAAAAGEAKNAQQILAAVKLASAGHLTATAAEIHPVLAKLTEAGLLASKSKGDRKVYSITEAGQEALALASEKLNEPSAEPSAGGSTDSATKTKRNFNLNIVGCDPNFLKAASKLAPALSDVAQTGTREQQQRATAVLEEARRQLHVILAEG